MSSLQSLASKFAAHLLASYPTEEIRAATATARTDPHAYAGRPVEYAEQVLGITTLTPDQKRILRLLHEAPCRILVPSGHNTGKTHLAAVAISYWYDSFDPGAVFTIGPRHDSLKDTIWGEVRRQRAKAGLRDTFIGPLAPEMRTATDHWAKAFTAAKDSSLTGRHLPHMLFVIEEACGVDPVWWRVIMTMFDASLGHAQLCIFNPTDSASMAYQQDILCDDPDGQALWHRVRLDSTTHPNVVAELRGEPKVVPYAVSLAQVEQAVKDGCVPLTNIDERVLTDLEWPPSSVTGQPGVWYRPGPEFQARWQGTWPDAGDGLWSPALWDAVLLPAHTWDAPPPFPLDKLPQIGVDCATGSGHDYHGIHCRWGRYSVHHETSNTMKPGAILARIKACAAHMALLVNQRRNPTTEPVKPTAIPVKLDADGVGMTLTDLLKGDGYWAFDVGAGRQALNPDKYPLMRSELWFQLQEKARAGLVNFSLLDKPTRARLRQQLLAVSWGFDGAQRRAVEPKDVTKEKILRSPDDADAAIIAYFDGIILERPATIENPRPRGADPSRKDSRARARGILGLRNH